MTLHRLQPGTVKICSLRTVEHAQFVLDAQPDLFGLIFAAARRQVSLETAVAITAAVRVGGPSAPKAVGVFVDQSAVEINQTAGLIGLHLVQLHGNEPASLMQQIERPVIKAIRPHPGTTVEEMHRQIYAYLSAAKPPIAILLDGFRADSPGGDGVRTDWVMAGELALRWPIMLAGGLTPESVGEAIRQVRPLGVDVSSGVEIVGKKSRERIVEFVRTAGSAFTADDASVSGSGDQRA